jgi:hypothetical protein
LLEAVLTRAPFSVAEPHLWRRVAEAVLDTVYIQIGADRFSANMSALLWIMNFVYDNLPTKVSAHWEPCWSHGCSLAKATGASMREVSACAISFSKQLRVGKTVDALRDSMIKVATRCHVRRFRPRPPGDIDRMFALRDAIFSGSEGDDLLYSDVKGVRRPTKLHRDFDDIARVVPLGDGSPEEAVHITHHCWTGRDSPEFLSGAKAEGAPCCDSVDACAELVWGTVDQLGHRVSVAHRLLIAVD